MAADHLNKRSKVSNVICHTSWEQQKAKKKKFSHYGSNMRSSISLEWDDKKENVVPKKEQISIAHRELAPFLPLVPHCQNVLGDVFAAPPELFELESLIDLLSYEVWQTRLSVQEREFLTQFLPVGAEPHKVVHELLAGNNLYFGNPFPKWGASVCSGDFHPDAVLRQEQRNKANKIAYYSELHKYHTKMIGSLQSWKERWASCVNPEKDFMQKIKIQRPQKDFHKSGSSHENGILCAHEDNFCATSDSCSWDADDKSYSSDSPNLTMMHGETLIRVSRMDLENRCDDSSGGWRSVARPRKANKLHKRNIECGDGAKYMSYIKVSKKQHQRVKSSMKHSNTSIQPRSLNHVLGNLDSFCVQPYEVFEEEERQRLHDHWSHLVKKDVPAGFENWKNWRSAKWQLTKSLRKELENKQKSNDVSVSGLYNQENEHSRTSLLHCTYNATLENGLMDTTKDEEKEQSLSSLHHEQQPDGETNELLIAPEDKEEQNGDSIFQSEAANHETEHKDESSHLQQIAIPNGSQNLCPMAIDSSNNVLTESDAFPCNRGGYTENMNHTAAPVGEIWPAASLPSAYYHQPPSDSHGYASVSDLSLGHPQVIVLESEIPQKDPLGSFVHRRTSEGGGDSFFNPYANQDRNELLLHSLFKDPVSSSYLHEQKQSRLGFPPASSDAMLGTGPFARNLSSSLPLPLPLPLDLRQKRSLDAYMHHNAQENMYADQGGMTRQEQFLPLNHVDDWPVNGNGVINNMGPSQNWFCGDGWSNQEIGNGSQVADESLFSVLSQCKGLRSVPFTTSNVVPPPPPPPGPGPGPGPGRPRVVNYMSEGQSMGWINLNGDTRTRSSWNDKDLGC